MYREVSYQRGHRTRGPDWKRDRPETHIYIYICVTRLHYTI